MDITFDTEHGRFNYRVCAIITHNNKLLAMHDECSPYFYLPGGRVKLHETAEKAVLREIKEELQINANIVRPLWLNQSYFIEEVSKEKYHEICLYFLLDIEKTDLLKNERNFTILENNHTHNFEWLPFDTLKNKYLYPNFIKEEIFNFPASLVLREEKEY